MSLLRIWSNIQFWKTELLDTFASIIYSEKIIPPIN